MSEPQLIITQKKSLFWYFAWGVLTVFLLYLSFYGGRYLAIEEQQETIEKAAWLEQKLAEYQQAYQKANEDLVMQTQSAKVDTQSNQQLVDSVKQLQETQRQLEAELKFYRNIMAPELEQEGLTIAEFELSKLNQGETPRFKLVLTQAGRQEQFLKGEVELKLHGQLNGSPTVYEFRELGTFLPKHFQFQFRYFQNIEGNIALPEGFIAQHVTIQAKTKGLRKNQTAEKQIDWNI
ncbi:DUF6776 family protein [Aliikangiella coralliicola]|uniref:Uncharacterized protein n=1 Tax=Aliikangiella coralliicola TaxID=2592383 RepID=A0A545U710_9GAMM|nr:DUF6776 family protein [Aliikangiella coralliicola]TQV85281.1 hypothetical protein FLL46_19125 [Aliikangiella coralliicola]